MKRQFVCKNNKSSEDFEANESFLQVSTQIQAESKGKTLAEVTRTLVAKVEKKYLFSKKLKTVGHSIGIINKIVDAGGAPAMVAVAEALKDRGIEVLGEAIRERGTVRAVLVAGPSSSGKTTFCKKLGLALESQGYKTLELSFDDYYVDREKTPLDENGEYDYESIYAINIDLFQRNLATLFAGGEIESPRYDFMTGKSVMSGKTMRLAPGTILIMEGIHALNPILTGSIPDEELFRIYISGLTVAKNDDGTFYPTTDNRLVRRLVRDSQFRNTTASETLMRWHSVRRGEEKWIVPFQRHADANFCTAYQYELALLKPIALPLLEQVTSDSPEYEEAQRLEWVLRRYHDIPSDLLPPHSLLREFVGGSAFEY